MSRYLDHVVLYCDFDDPMHKFDIPLTKPDTSITGHVSTIHGN